MKSINPNVYPKEGYKFIESDNSRHVADSWTGVIARVVAYRKRAGLPPGDPQTEVIAQACQRNPILCQDNDPTFLTKKASLKSRILTWLNGIRGQKDKQFVDDQTAKARSAVCAGCKFNRPIPEGCATCKAAVKHLRDEILGRRFVDGRLNDCHILGEDLPVSVYLESQTVENGELPGHCWRRRSL